MKIKKIFLLIPFFSLLYSGIVHAHCPLCTAGAAVAAGGALWLGISKIVVALFIGAFAVSMGWWIGNKIKKQYVPYQKHFLVLISFLLTVIPILPIVKDIFPIYISLAGGYGSLLNRTYIIDKALLASLLGGAVIYISPWVSSKITGLRNGKFIPFQGIIITFIILFILGGLIQLLL